MRTDKKPIFPCEPWCVTETGFDPANNFRNETTFSLSNGYIGTRGTFEESYNFDESTGLEGNFINGFYGSEKIRYGEFGFGFPKMSQSMLNVANAKIIRLYLDGELFDMRMGTVGEYRRTLHLDEGIVTRQMDWTAPSGKQVRIRTERLVSFADKHLMAIRYEVTPLNFSGVLRLESELDGDVVNHTAQTNPLIDYGPYGRVLTPEQLAADGETLKLTARAKNSGLTMCCVCGHNFSGEGAPINRKESYCCAADFEVFAEQGKPVVMEKYIAYAAKADGGETDLQETAEAAITFAKETGFDGLLRLQKEYMAEFWQMADVTIKGDASVQQGLRFNLFHVMQAAGRDGTTGMAAKGLSGEGYEGHYFWDTEMYILPVFTHTFPALAKKLLDYRYHTLKQARARAKEMGHPSGALYPWRTINGSEASAYYPLGTAQYHINADIAYAFMQYVRVTGDEAYLADKAAEVLCETARIWADIGCFAESRDGRYCICCVTGPDEYNALVDNNFYTNLMAREHLRDALAALEHLKIHQNQACQALCKKITLLPEELELWQKIIDKMYLPYDERLGIYPQDDGFLQRKPWDESAIPQEKRHLLYENYHPLFVFRHRMAKQADAILGMYLHDNLFTKEELKRNFDFYQTVTVHHSSLSTCIFGMLACKLGETAPACEYFRSAARMDLDDYHENFYAGIHAANMAGSWLMVINGFAGMRTNAGVLSFNPFLPKEWEGYCFKICYRGAVLGVKISGEDVCYELMNECPVVFSHGEKEIHLNKKGEKAHEKI